MRLYRAARDSASQRRPSALRAMYAMAMCRRACGARPPGTSASLSTSPSTVWATFSAIAPLVREAVHSALSVLHFSGVRTLRRLRLSFAPAKLCCFDAASMKNCGKSGQISMIQCGVVTLAGDATYSTRSRLLGSCVRCGRTDARAELSNSRLLAPKDPR